MKKMITTLLTLLLICSSVCITVFAQDNTNHKFDQALTEKLAQSEDSDLIHIWIWFTDIDMNQVEKEVEEQTGIAQKTIDDIAIPKIPQSLKDALDRGDEEALNDETKKYLELKKPYEDEKERLRQIYQIARFDIVSEKYNAQNTGFVDEIGVEKDNIKFLSSLSPCAIITISKQRILEIKDFDFITSIFLYDETEYPEPTEPTIEESAPSPLEADHTGDADCDGQLTIIDATLIQKYLAGVFGEDKIYLPGADFDGDNSVTIVDATCIQKTLVSVE